jgi:GH35 family endo-1,4-beta-xylanase
MDWKDSYNHPPFTELPVELREQIDRYQALIAYTQVILGAGINFDLYVNDGEYEKIVNQNFKSITAGNEMKQWNLMTAAGDLNFDNVDPVIQQLKSTGMDIYGHVLVWHNQQRAGYFNNLIKDKVEFPPSGGNLLTNGDFTDGMDGWGQWGDGSTNEIVTIDGINAVKITVPNSGDAWSVQLRTPVVQTIVGHQYEVSFWIRSEEAGEVRLSIGSDGMMSDKWPTNNDAIEGRPNGVVATGPVAKQIVYSSETTSANPWVAIGTEVQFDLDLGQTAGVYYIYNVEVIDLDAEVDMNILTNGSFEDGDPMTGWGQWGSDSSNEIVTGDVIDGTNALKITVPNSGDAWSVQLRTPEVQTIEGHEYEVSFWIRSEEPGEVRLSIGSDGMMSDKWPTNNDAIEGRPNGVVATNSSWKEITYSSNTTSAAPWTAIGTMVQFDLDLGQTAGVYYIDNVRVIDLTAAAEIKSSKVLRAGPIITPLTPEEKFAILEPVFKKYITDVVTHFGEAVTAWEVVNEPMNENGTLREGEENMSATDVFYWQYYLGKDYAVTAFKTAREAAPNAKLFINDFNLESASGAKLQGLIDYVSYIESQGVTVDGIGTQMHLNINWSDMPAIKTMFEKLAATGKLIKVTELDIAMSTASGHGEGPENPINPTLDQYAQQAELYRYVAEMYTQIIPVNQQYGITLWCVTDSEKEHEYWLPNDAPCLWDANYIRKHAYKGFADGLAGKDIGAEFKQDSIWGGK